MSKPGIIESFKKAQDQLAAESAKLKEQEIIYQKLYTEHVKPLNHDERKILLHLLNDYLHRDEE